MIVHTLLFLIVAGGGISRGMGIFLNFHKLEDHNKITLGEDRKSTLEMRGVKIKWRGGYLFLYIKP